MAPAKQQPAQNGIAPRGPSGPGVDAMGQAVLDPTLNVKELSQAANARQDDLREKDREISDIKHSHLAEVVALRASHEAMIGKLREEYQEKIQRAESGRLDSIRQVDREEVAKTAVAANTAITTLAKQTTDLQQTLAKQVTDTAAAQEARNSSQYSDTNKRLSALELSSSEGKGKQTVVDPQIAEFMRDMRAVLVAGGRAGGKSEGISWTGVLIAGAVTAIFGLMGIAAMLYSVLKP